MPYHPKIAVYPGTFDPITKGHSDIIARAAMLVDRLVIAVAENQEKGPIFPLEARIQMVEEEVKSLALPEGVVVLVKPFNTLLVQFAEAENAHFVVRGLRAIADFEYEFQMAGMNARLSPSIETIFLIASDRCQFISSRLIKEICKLGGNIESFVSPYVYDCLKKRLEF